MFSQFASIQQESPSDVAVPDDDKLIIIDTTSTGLFSMGGINQSVYTKFMNDYSKLELDDDFELIITTPGGDMFYVLLIAKVLQCHQGNIMASIPRFAMSGGSLIALMCDQIYINAYACMGPIDLQMSIFSIQTVLPVMEQWKETNSVIGIVYSMMSKYQTDYSAQLRDLLVSRYSVDEIDELLVLFFSREHSMPIFPTELTGYVIVDDVKYVPKTQRSALGGLFS
ncbi:hypothetical protein OAV62_01295 [bacterium]|nr:hypothetical protein [bacterium]